MRLGRRGTRRCNAASLDGQTPFAGRVDSFSTGGQLSIEDQYKVAQSVWDEKMEWDDPIRLPMQIRNKLHWGLKILGNKGMRKATGLELPVVSSLQMMSAVDQRAGLRNYMTIRANDLMIEQAAINPEGSLDDWAAAAQAQLDDQLYQATPTKQNIEDAREQFSLSREDLSDEEVAEYIVSAKVGMPVLNSPGQPVQIARPQRCECRTRSRPPASSRWTRPFGPCVKQT